MSSNPTYSQYRESFIRTILAELKSLEKTVAAMTTELPKVVERIEMLAELVAHPERLPDTAPSSEGTPAPTNKE